MPWDEIIEEPEIFSVLGCEFHHHAYNNVYQYQY